MCIHCDERWIIFVNILVREREKRRKSKGHKEGKARLSNGEDKHTSTTESDKCVHFAHSKL